MGSVAATAVRSPASAAPGRALGGLLGGVAFGRAQAGPKRTTDPAGIGAHRGQGLRHHIGGGNQVGREAPVLMGLTSEEARSAFMQFMTKSKV